MLSGWIALLLMLLFVGLWVWAWRPARRKHFDAAARMPLEDDRSAPPAAAPARSDGSGAQQQHGEERQ